MATCFNTDYKVAGISRCRSSRVGRNEIRNPSDRTRDAVLNWALKYGQKLTPSA